MGTFDPARAYRLHNAVQNYDWGSRTELHTLLDVPNPQGLPQAEVWMGAHPKAPSFLTSVDGGREPEVSMLDAIAQTADRFLGTGVAAAFNGSLPFLFKLLCADKALSIQAHPNLTQAKEGFARENRLGIALDAPNRNYRDDNHKPEVLCAITDFTGMCGFRQLGDIRRELEALSAQALAPVLASLAAGDSTGLKAAFAALLRLAPADRDTVLRAASERAHGRSEERYRWVLTLLEQFPGDIGALSPLILNLVHLKPTEAMFLDAGVLHAYLRGTGVELMANSDNVLRGGLTVKHVDVPELLRLVTFEPLPVDVVPTVRGSAGETIYRTPNPEFRLARIDVDPSAPFTAAAVRSVEIIVAIAGEIALETEHQSISLTRGQSIVVPAGAPRYTLRGSGRLYRADIALPPKSPQDRTG